ncbi:MAG: glycerol-3-phosphate acyltransferase, partial [Bacteroidales bacterium]|nr:glycerol-3-phosphate acyltransferase [Bacteroidales bacterium]
MQLQVVSSNCRLGTEDDFIVLSKIMYTFICSINDMDISLKITIAIILAYLIGSIPASIWIGRRFYGVDIRTAGSGNAGATNTIRVLGAKIGLAVLAIDVAKGWFAVHLSCLFSLEQLSSEQFIGFQILLGIAAIIGHIFPIYIKFKGGKGV